MCERCVRREKHTELPSAVGPRSACVHLTNEMSHGEDGATKRSLQTNSPPALDCKNSPRFRKELAWPANWPHHSQGSFFIRMFGCGETARSALAQQLCHLKSREANGGLIGLLNAAGDPLSYLVFSSTLRICFEVKSTLVSSFWTSKSRQWREVSYASTSSTPFGLVSLLLSSLQHCQWVRLIPLVIETHLGGIKV